ncbi:MAG TPA: A/G-specific adenine glycosylase [Gallionella sp.]|nr:A/G-specific adenine glycosylase [Gallionella sp.]
MSSFSSRLIAWQHRHGRHDLPWQGASPYHIWLSEIMLQQTQVATVIPYYQRFVGSFPSITALASASEDQVLAHWSGLGYYARARNLHRAAQLMVEKYRGEFPRDFEQILALPGIGRSTAAAICAFAYHECRAILDGNVKRVLARYCGISGHPNVKEVQAQLWQQAEVLLPLSAAKHHQQNGDADAIVAYTQGLMDLGATLCKRNKPDCAACPVGDDCVAWQTGRVNELPTPRIRKAVPERHATFLLILHDNHILLEKRAPTGVWGSLWCLPQLGNAASDVADYVQQNRLAVGDKSALPVFTHTFTHFKLHITPILLHLTNKPKLLQQSGNIWLDIEDAMQAAIPTPVRKMLAALCNSTVGQISLRC